jgi:hypothetical protein
MLYGSKQPRSATIVTVTRISAVSPINGPKGQDMKLTHLIAAGLMVAGLGISTTAASAQDYRHDDRRGDHRGPDWRDHGRDHRWNNHRRCHTEWRHHRRVTVCR